MSSWQRLEDGAPEIASAGRRLLTIPGVGFGYLATADVRGAPRIHPINVVFHDGGLYAFIVPSPKLGDLRRDGRYALHSTGTEEISDEFCVMGRAHEAPFELRPAVVAAAGYTVNDDHVLVELGAERALWAAWTTPPRWPPTYHRWRVG
jgi:hypothetical protein